MAKSLSITNPRAKENRKTGGKRTKEQRDADMLFEADLFVKGYTYRQIADSVNANIRERGLTYTISFQQVHKDVKELLISWKKERFDLIDDYVTSELKKLDRMEQELWAAWEASKDGKRRTKIEGGSIEGGNISGGKLKERNLETTHGNPRYMDLLLDVQQRRAKLLGYDAPTKIDIHKPDNPFSKDETEYNLDSLPVELMEKMAEAMMRDNSKKLRENG
jgi:hypothetical protein